VPLRSEKARALLKEAGYDANHPLHFTILTDNEKQVFANISTLLKEQYRKLGAEAKVEVQDKVTWMTYMVGKNRCQWDVSWRIWRRSSPCTITATSRRPARRLISPAITIKR